MGDGGGSGFSWVGTWSWWRVLSFPMNPPRPLSETTISRRSALGLLLAAGLWPGCVRVPSTQRPAGAPFTFAALNDLHHAQPECDPWFEAVFAQVAQVRPAFILLLGDLADRGDPASFATVRRLSERVGVPCYAVPGNHDNDVEKTPALFAAAFSGVLNSRFQHEGWQFVGLDSSDENKWRDTRVSAASLAWLDRELASLDPERPTMLFTHFPLAPDIRTQQGYLLTPLNAEAVLQRLVALQSPRRALGALSRHHRTPLVPRPVGHRSLLLPGARQPRRHSDQRLVVVSRRARRHPPPPAGAVDRGVRRSSPGGDGFLRRRPRDQCPPSVAM